MDTEKIPTESLEEAPIVTESLEEPEKTPEEIEVLIEKMITDFKESKRKRREIENSVGLSEEKNNAVWLALKAEHEWDSISNGLSSLKHVTLGYLKRLPGAKILESKQNKLEDQETFDQIMKKFGDSITITEAEDHRVKKSLKELNMLPENLVSFLKEEGLKVRVGIGNVNHLSDNAFSKNHDSPRGYPKLFGGWNHVGGVFDPTSSTVFVGGTISGSKSTALHEYGHGVGELLRVNFSQQLAMAHQRFFDRLESYYKQEGQGGYAGKQELLAESFAEYFTIPKEKFVRKYDEEWHSFLTQVINSPRVGYL